MPGSMCLPLTTTSIAAVPGDVGIVVMRDQIEPGLPERQLVRVEIEHVGLVLVDEVLGPEEPVLAEAFDRHRVALGQASVRHLPMPCSALALFRPSGITTDSPQ